MMIFKSSFVYFLLLVVVNLFQSKKQERICLSQLPKIIKEEMDLYDDWVFGIDVLAQLNQSDMFKRIYSHQNTELLNPASTNKLPTCSVALLELGENFQFSTSLYDHSDGDRTMCLKFQGDPSMDIESFKNMIVQIGKDYQDMESLTLDMDSFFGKYQADFPSTWEYDDLTYEYAARPISAVVGTNKAILRVTPDTRVGYPSKCDTPYSLVDIKVDCSNLIGTENVNQIHERIQVGSSTFEKYGYVNVKQAPYEYEFAVVKPQDYILDLVKSFLPLRQVYRTSECHGSLIKSFYSDSLELLMNHTLLVSDNTYAELFGMQVGSQFINDTFDTSFSKGIEREREVLEKTFGIDGGLFSRADFSGVSRRTFLSTKMLVELLKGMYEKKPSFKYLLPLAGESGTLKHRYLDHKGLIRAKTGTLTGVGALAGYIVKSQYYKEMIFSIIVNHSLLPADEIRKHIDKIVVDLSNTDPSC